MWLDRKLSFIKSRSLLLPVWQQIYNCRYTSTGIGRGGGVGIACSLMETAVPGSILGFSPELWAKTWPSRSRPHRTSWHPGSLQILPAFQADFRATAAPGSAWSAGSSQPVRSGLRLTWKQPVERVLWESYYGSANLPSLIEAVNRSHRVILMKILHYNCWLM